MSMCVSVHLTCMSTVHALSIQLGCGAVTGILNPQDYADLHVVALSVLARCLEDTQNMQALQSSGCLNKLLEHVKDSSSAELKQNAVSVTGRACVGVPVWVCLGGWWVCPVVWVCIT